jgi:phosphatidylglycerol:prolipoprotein diacylglycerol transferase
MYVLGFTAAYLLVVHQAKKFAWKPILRQLDDLNLVLILGVILGGRLGYVLFYNPTHYLNHPFEIAAIWSGGMSFHGGCVGVLLAGWMYCRRTGLDFWTAADLFVVTVPVGLFFGRLGNFINGELYGRPTAVPWGMVFPGGGPSPRHPSQLYEAALEGMVLFVILWTLKAKPWRQPKAPLWPHGTMLALFLTLYGLFRFLIEFFRQPDPQLGLVFFNFSMGQVLSFAMIGVGILLWYWQKTAQARRLINRPHR